MQKIGSSTSTADANGEFTEGSGAGGVKATQLKAAWLNSIQRELIGLLTEAGLSPKADDDTQLRAAVKAIAKAISNAYGIGGAAVDGSKVNLNDAGLGTILRFEGSQTDALALNYPSVSSTGTVQVNFETLTYGMAGRIVQETTEIFGAGGQGRGRTLFRVKHDTTWYPWREVAMLDSPVPTKSTGDNSQSMANTAFVKGQRGSVLAKAVDGSADVTLSADEAGNPILWLSGALTGNISVILPAAQSRWVVYNRTTGAYTLTLKTPSSTQNVVIAQGAQAEIICGGSNLYRTHSELPDVIGNIQATGELRSTSANALRMVNGDYGAFFRNDGGTLYLLLTAKGDPYGVWNSIRPFSVNLATGKVAMSAGLEVLTRLRGDNTNDAASTSFVQDAAGTRTAEVVFFPSSTAPSGFLKANGAAISRTTYAALFSVIGTNYGAGDGSTTFNLPDLRGEFVRAWDDGRGVDSGRALNTSQASQNLAHNHTATAANAGAHNHTFTLRNDRAAGDGNAVYGDEAFYSPDATLGTSTAGDHTHTITIASSGGTEARPRNVALLACIKY